MVCYVQPQSPERAHFIAKYIKTARTIKEMRFDIVWLCYCVYEQQTEVFTNMFLGSLLLRLARNMFVNIALVREGARATHTPT